MKRFKAIIYGFSLSCSLVFAERFEVNSGVVYDSKTQLYWQQNPSNLKFNWQNAQNHCINLNVGGYSDWRLPNLYELKSLVDYSKYNPAIVTTRIVIKTDDWYWSSSKDVSDSSGAWSVSFDSGGDDWSIESGEDYALCVRGQ